MIKKSIICLICLILFSGFMITQPSAQEYDLGSIIVKFKHHSPDQTRNRIMSDIHGHVRTKKFNADRPLLGGDLVVIELEDGTASDAIQNLQNSEYIEYAEYNRKVYLTSTTPNDTSFSTLWHLHNTGQTGGTADADMDGPEAWDIETGDSAIIVGVIDTGADYYHEDLANNIWTNPSETPGNGIDDDNNGYIDDIHGINAITGSGDPMDDHFHGTACSGILGAVGDNSTGIVGVCWNVKIIPIKFINSAGSGLISDAIESIQYAIDLKENGVDIRVLSNSWGYQGSPEQSLADAIEAANEAGMLFVCAAGNESKNNDVYPFYPASYTSSNVISVASTDKFDNLSSFSNFGATSVDVAAPGTNILCLFPDDDYDYLSGTSMATPQVAGLMALILSKNPTLNMQEVKSYVFSYGDTLSSLNNKCVTGKRVNMYGSLSHVPDPVPTFNISVSPTIKSIAYKASSHVTIESESIAYFSDLIDLTVESDPEINASISFDPNTINPGNSSTLSIQTSEFTDIGVYHLTITGTSGSISKEVVLELEVYPDDRFSIEYINTNSTSIPDNDPNGIISTISVSEDLTIWKINCEVNITHPYTGDLIVKLKSPSGTDVYLYSKPGEPGENINGTFYSYEFQNELATGDWLFYVSDNASGNTGALCSWKLTLDVLPNNKYAILIDSGSWSGSTYHNEVRYWNDTAAMFNCLMSYDFEAVDIHVLMADGDDFSSDLLLRDGNSISSPLDLDGDETNDVDYAATKTNLASALSSIGSKIHPQDTLFIYMTGEGLSESGSDTAISMYQEYMQDNEFASMLANYIDCNNVIIIMQQDYSGGFVDDLQSQGRLVISATSYSERSKARTLNAATTAQYDEFSYHFISALSQKTLGDDDPNSVMNYEISDLPIYTNTNGDNILSISEVHQNTLNNDYWHSQGDYHPQYYANPSDLFNIGLGDVPPIGDPSSQPNMCFITADRRLFIIGTDSTDTVTAESDNGIYVNDNYFDSNNIDYIDAYLFNGNDSLTITAGITMDKIYTSDGDDTITNAGSINYAYMDADDDTISNSNYVYYIMMGQGTDTKYDTGTIDRYIDPIVGKDGDYEFSTIQSAIDYYGSGADICVAPGTYYETINFNGKGVYVHSLDPLDNSIVSSTVIDGEGVRRGVIFNTGETSTSILAGFTIQNCSYTSGRAGAVRFGSTTSARISYCDIHNNTASIGGAISCYNWSGTISNCKIHDNTASTMGGAVSCEIGGSIGKINACQIYNNESPLGGGIYLTTSYTAVSLSTIEGNSATNGGGIYDDSSYYYVVKQNIIRNNSVSNSGGGIYIGNGGTPLILNNSIVDNGAAFGGGIYCTDSAHPTVKLCTFANNNASDSGQSYYCNSYIATTFLACILWDQNWLYVAAGYASPNITYSDVYGGYNGSGNINSDPIFVGNDDYHLSSISPCIDTATNGISSIDLDGNSRPIDGDNDSYAITDIGAYEYQL